MPRRPKPCILLPFSFSPSAHPLLLSSFLRPTYSREGYHSCVSKLSYVSASLFSVSTDTWCIEESHIISVVAAVEFAPLVEMIKRRFYKVEHGDDDGPSDSSSSESDLEAEAEASEESEDDSDNEVREASPDSSSTSAG